MEFSDYQNVVSGRLQTLELTRTMLNKTWHDEKYFHRRSFAASKVAESALLAGMALSRASEFASAKEVFSSGADSATDFVSGIDNVTPEESFLAEPIIYCCLLSGQNENAHMLAQALVGGSIASSRFGGQDSNIHAQMLAAFVLSDAPLAGQLAGKISLADKRGNEWIRRGLSPYRSAWLSVLHQDQGAYNAAVTECIKACELRARAKAVGSELYGWGGDSVFAIDFVAVATARVALARGLSHEAYTKFLPEELVAFA